MQKVSSYQAPLPFCICFYLLERRERRRSIRSRILLRLVERSPLPCDLHRLANALGRRAPSFQEENDIKMLLGYGFSLKVLVLFNK
jgi:hypothetical protein